jgi:hypothetical protein
MSHANSNCRLGALALLGVSLPLGACGDATVDLGSGRIGQNIQRGARCAESPVAAGSVRVKSQAELAELAGCEQIDGDLQIEVFPGADLSPLASLRAIDGLLELGARPELPEQGVDTSVAIELQEQLGAIVADGYLTSLQGLESLERVTGLDLYDVGVQDLSALQGLRVLTGHEGALPVGWVGIHDTQLHTLQGLQNVEHITQLVLSDNLQLESLGGVALSPAMLNINLVNSPQLTSIAELAGVERATTLYLDNIGVSDVESLANLYYVEFGISITGNRNLLDIDALGAVSTESLVISNNALLERIPAFPNLAFLESFTATRNPALHSIELSLPGRGQGQYSAAGTLLTDPVHVIEIGQNPQLTQLSVSAGLEEARYLSIYLNPSLASVTLGTLTEIQSLEISDNTSLTQLDLGPLERVGTLFVIGNSSLDVSPLAAVRTFETTLRGNAPAAAP